METLFQKTIAIFLCVCILLCIPCIAHATTTKNGETETINLVGNTRITTAINISNVSNPGKSINTAIIIAYNDFVDGLAAAGLSGVKNAPIFYNDNYYTLCADIKIQLQKLGVNFVYIIGGEKVLSQKIEDDLRALNISSKRISGNDRYETSLKLAKEIDSTGNLNGIFLTKSGLDSSISAATVCGIAATHHYSIIYHDGGDNKNVSQYLNDFSKPIYAVGNVPLPASISKNIPTENKISGFDRYETNKKVIDKFGNYDSLIVVGSVVDATSASYLAAKTHSNILIAMSLASECYEVNSIKKASKIYQLCNKKFIDAIYGKKPTTTTAKPTTTTAKSTTKSTTTTTKKCVEKYTIDDIKKHGQTVYLTYYTPRENEPENWSTSILGKVVERKGKNYNIVNRKVGVNELGWYTYSFNGENYVILARLKNSNGSYCGLDKKEIVYFVFKNKVYKGVILDFGGAARKNYAGLDIYATPNCKNVPGNSTTPAYATNKFIKL